MKEITLTLVFLVLAAVPPSGSTKQLSPRTNPTLKTTPAPQEPIIFMGVTLGSELSGMHECDYEDMNRVPGFPPIYMYTYKERSAACWSASRPNQGLPTASDYSLSFMPLSRFLPKGIRMPELHVVAGRIEGIKIRTDGFRHQEDLFALLKSKFGEPTMYSTEPVQNAMGASFHRQIAAWDWPNLHVSFLGMGDSIDAGFISVETKAGSDASKAELPLEKSF